MRYEPYEKISILINQQHQRRVHMKSIRNTLIVVMAIILFSAVSVAQEYSLKGRSALELNIGFWGGGKSSNAVSATGFQSESKTNGLLGNIQYSRWIQEQLSVTVGVGYLAGETRSTVSVLEIGQRSSAVVPLLVGVNYYFINPGPEDAVRPFISAAIGTYIGSEASNTIVSQTAHSEAAFGGRFGAGLDFLLSNHIKMGMNVGYNLMTDYTSPVGARKSYNGADASIGIGYIF
jgi:hypothetical protein